MLHTIYVIGVMFVVPAICVIVEYSRNREKRVITLFCKWFVFWSIGIRAITGGLMQSLNPSYTADLLHVITNDYIIIRELGFCNLAFGVMGCMSIFSQAYRKPAALSYGIFMLGAAIIHITRLSMIELGEFMSLTGDLFVVAIAVTVFIADRKKVLYNR